VVDLTKIGVFRMGGGWRYEEPRPLASLPECRRQWWSGHALRNNGTSRIRAD